MVLSHKSKYLVIVLGIVIILSLFSTFVTGWPWLCWYHDYLLIRYERSLASIELPNGCSILKTRRAFVPPWRSNHLDALAIALVECERGILPEGDEVLNAPFDDGVLLPPLHVIGQGPFQLVSTSSLGDFPLEPFEEYMDNLVELAGINIRSGSDYYILLALDQVRSGFHMWDYRGN